MGKRNQNTWQIERAIREVEWMLERGATKEGYVKRYGDPGVKTAEGKFMFGDGGSMIFEADFNALAAAIYRAMGSAIVESWREVASHILARAGELLIAGGTVSGSARSAFEREFNISTTAAPEEEKRAGALRNRASILASALNSAAGQIGRKIDDGTLEAFSLDPIDRLLVQIDVSIAELTKLL